MNKGAILCLLIAGLVAGSYVEFQVHQSDGQAEPVLEATGVTPDVTAEPTEAVEAAAQEGPTFTPFTAAPSITNGEEVVGAMQEAYPPLLREAGIGGRVLVYFFIEADGEVTEVRINESSGHPALDDAALRVADVYHFTPALNHEERVPVWVTFPITFQVR